jgi:hypothetical protein
VRHAALSEVAQHVDRARQRPPLGQELTEQLAVPALQRLRLLQRELTPDLAGCGPREQAAAHPHTAVDAPAVDRQPFLRERALPREDMRVNGVDEGSVEVEDERRHVERSYARRRFTLDGSRTIREFPARETDRRRG